MTQQEYLSQTVLADSKWFNSKANLYHFLHIFSRLWVILISAFITIISGIQFDHKDILIAILGSVIVVVTSISELMKFKDQWLEYRTTAEQIKSEKNLFETSTEPYNKEGSFNLFVKNHEEIIKSENQKWHGYIADKS